MLLLMSESLKRVIVLSASNLTLIAYVKGS